ncbi:MAG: S41 family peptidase [Clostridia bacterium]|nr:S41 family peptidase [Clostridia bacterium]
MKKRVSILTTIIIALVCVIVTFQITAVAYWKRQHSGSSAPADTSDTSSYESLKEKLDEINGIYREYYIGEIDEESLERGVMMGYVYGAGDQFGEYMDPESYKEYLKESGGELVGIGIMVIEDLSTGLMQVVEVMPGTPAEEAGLQVGDLIAFVAGEDAAAIGYYRALDLMRGEEGSTAVFSVYRGGEQVDFRIVRKKIESVSVTHRMYSDGKTGIIRITGFEEPTPGQFIDAMKDLRAQGAERYVFDLRNNGGGLLTAITETLDYLLPNGPIIRITDKDGNVLETVNSDKGEVVAPMAVLVNGNTASAAELFTAALRDYDKSVTVGTTTYGKGSMQTIVPLSDGSAVRISFRMYSPPKSDNYHGVGIKPDVEVELDPSLKNLSLFAITDEQDNQLQAAIAELDKWQETRGAN